jgi:SHS2 domain-containing protein
MQFEYLEHTADIKFKAYGNRLEDLFTNILKACTNILTDINKIKKEKEIKISIKSKKIENLAYDFIEELLFLIDTESLIFNDFKEMKITKTDKEYILEGTLLGDYYKNYEINGDIKAATYNDMQFIKNKDKYEMTIVVDI